jgi:hypothetical protein
VADLIVQYVLTTPGPDITFNSGPLGDGVDKYWIQSIQGLDGPAIRAPVDPVPFGDGGLIHTFWKGPRRVLIDGILLLDPSTTFECQERRNDLAFNLQDALASIIAANGTLAWNPTGSVGAKSLTVRNEIPLDIRYSDNYMVSTFSFGLVSAAADPA